MLISQAWAQDAAAGGGMGGQLFGFLPILLIFVIFYFLIIRPQNEEAKKHAAMVKALKKGDKVLTQGGVCGEVSAVEEAFVRIEVAGGVEMTFARGAVQRLLGDGEAKALRGRKR